MSTKVGATLLASTSVAAGATANSSTLSALTGYGALLTGTMVNGATAPTAPCVATCQVSSDGTTWDTYLTATASSGASVTTSFAFEVSIYAMQVRVSFSGHTGAAVTCACRSQHTTAL